MTTKPIQPKSFGPHHQQLTKQAQKLVGQTFYGTLMKQMHNSPFKSQTMSGGRGGEAFAPLMDQHLIDRMSARAGGKKLIDTIVKHLEARETRQNNSTSLPGADEKPQRVNPFENVRIHVAPGLGT